MLSGSARAVSLRAQPLSGPRDPPSRTVGGPQPLPFGDPRVMALVGALCAGLHVITGFTNRSLRARVSTLLGMPYSMGQMSYDLRRLSMKGLIRRLPRSNTYVLTPDGQTDRDLLHQAPHPAPAAAHHGQRPTRPAAHPSSAPRDRPPRRRLHHRGPHACL